MVAYVLSEATPEEMTDRLVTLLGNGVHRVDWFPISHSFDGPADKDWQEDLAEEVSNG